MTYRPARRPPRKGYDAGNLWAANHIIGHPHNKGFEPGGLMHQWALAFLHRASLRLPAPMVEIKGAQDAQLNLMGEYD